MAYPVLAAQSTWFAPNNSSINRSSITEIEFMDSYIPDTSITVTDTWDASAKNDNSITCYVLDKRLIIAGNGSGRISANPDSSYLFFNTAWGKPCFTNLIYIKGLEYLDTSEVTDMTYMFYSCKKLLNVDLSGFNTKNVVKMSSMFCLCESLIHLDLSSFDTSNVTNMAGLCQACTNLETAIMPNIDTTKSPNMYGMFTECSNLSSLQIPQNFINSSTTSIRQIFNECTKLCNLDTSGWDTSNCTDMEFAFYSCSSLGEIDVSTWDVSKVTNFDHFAAHAKLRRKGIENWKPISATNMNALFHNCAEEELDLSGWDVSKNQFFCQMFENSPNLKRIKGLEKWNTSAGLGFDGMFERCYKLEELDLSSFNTSNAKNGTKASVNGHTTATLQNMFLSCNNLKKVTVGPNFSINGNGSNTTAGNKAILPTPSTDYIEGADGNWYTFAGDVHAPNAMKDKTAETYYASYNVVADADVIVKNGSLIDTAKAIREKNGSTDKYTPAQFGTAIRAL